MTRLALPPLGGSTVPPWRTVGDATRPEPLVMRSDYDWWTRPTARPWRVEGSMLVADDPERVEPIEYQRYYGGARTLVAESMSAADARLVVAAVNACLGFNVEDLERGAVANIVAEYVIADRAREALAEECVEYARRLDDATAEIHRLRAEVGRLQAARRVEIVDDVHEIGARLGRGEPMILACSSPTEVTAALKRLLVRRDEGKPLDAPLTLPMLEPSPLVPSAMSAAEVEDAEPEARKTGAWSPPASSPKRGKWGRPR